ncbi:MAG: helix-turn-helix domain-containing protein [Myxococcales bacterium]|nr:helix-turn-helix domain-containing protein [Myxococcales bacterium]
MIQRIGPEAAQHLLTQGDLDVVDVREPHEWSTGHLPTARLVPLGQLRADLDGARLGRRVLFVCERGGRSLAAAEAVQDRVAELYSLDGGTAGWRAAGLPITVPGAAPGAGGSAEPQEEALSPELDAIVARNVKELRGRRGWSLDVLAGASGVARQTLGQIELGQRAPSLGTLWRIAGALEVPFSALLAQPRPGKPLATRVFRHAAQKPITGAEGRFASRALFSSDGRPTFELYELWLAGYGREDAEAHAAGTRENLVVTSGRLVLEIGKERHELGKGDAVEFTADVAHSYVNPASEECFMVLAMSYPGLAQE